MILAAAGVAVSLYFIFIRDRNDFFYLFAVSLLVLMIAYVFQYQIDQLMVRGIPQTIPPAMRAMLIHTAPHFQQMTNLHKKMIEDRMQRWIMKKEFISQNKQDPPEDVKYILAYYGALLTMHQEDYLYDGIDRIVFYHHPFLTPHHSYEVHIVEVEKTDGTIIVSVPDLLKGHLEKGYYNLAAHAMAEAYRLKYLDHPIHWPDDIWEQLESISSIPKTRLEEYLGLMPEDPWPVAVHHQIVYQQSSIREVVSILPQLV